MKHSFGSRLGIVLITVFALSGACIANDAVPDDSEFRRLAERASRVTIVRDDFGVPHVYGRSDADAVFGLLYAQAEDDFPRIERNYVTAIGRLAEIDGEEALFSDLRARLYMSLDEAKTAYANAPGWLRELCIAFADGLNFYLATHPEVRPELLTRFEPWMPMYFSEGSIGGNIEKVSLDGIRRFYDRPGPATGPSSEPPEHHAIGEPKGSNGFAIAGKLTRSGNAMLLINPHTSFYFRGEAHMVSEDGLNAYGAVTWGQFFVYQGFNEYTGWMHTSTKLDFMDEFTQEIVERGGRHYYRYGDELRPVHTSSVTLKYRDGNGFSERLFPVYRTHHGPVTHLVNGKWTTTRIHWEPVDSLRQSFLRTKTRDHREFRAMMDIRANSSNNTVYADTNGTIAYYHGNFVPRRNRDFDYTRPVDGSRTETDWQGLHTVDELLTIVNPENGWLQNCNSTPFTAAGEFSPNPENFADYMAPDPENFRGIHATRVLTGRSEITLDDLIDMAYDPYLPGFEVLIPGLIEAWDDTSDRNPALTAAIDELRHWDYRTSVESVAMTLGHFYGMHFIEHGANPHNLEKMALIEYFARETSHPERLHIFELAVSDLERSFGDWAVQWGDVNRFQRITGDILPSHDDEAPSLPIGLASGTWGALASFGSRRFPGTRRLYGKSGNSFVAVVEFGDKVRARSLLAGGQSGDPSSAHFTDQAELYARARFKDVAFYREDVEKRARHTYRPGE